MGRIANRLFRRVPDPVVPTMPLATRFGTIGPDQVPPEFFGLSSYETAVAPAPRIDRRTAMQVGAVKRSRDLIAGLLGTLPIDLVDAAGRPARSALLEQPERGIARSVTLAATFEDLLLEGVAWWLVTEYDAFAFPAKVRRLEPRTVDVKQDGTVHVTKMGHRGMSLDWGADLDLIRFDSPNDALLVAGARSIRTCLRLDAAAALYSEGNQPLDYFTAKDKVDPPEEDLDAALDGWVLARQQRATGYVPAGLEYKTAGWNPEQLQLADQRQNAVLDIARHAGVDPEDLGVSTTSRTYFNAFDRKQARMTDTLRAYMVAFEERLSMPDVTPAGTVAKLNTTDLLRTSDLERFQAYRTGLAVGVYEDGNEVRAAEGKPPVASPVTRVEGIRA